MPTKPKTKKAGQGIISRFLDKDHAYLDRLWQIFLDGEGEIKQQLKRFYRFKNRILLHIKFEDEFLFPRLNDYLQTSGNSGLTAIAYKDHGNIIKLMDMVEIAGTTGDLRRMKAIGSHLDSVIKKHRALEQKLHYPVSDSFIKTREWNLMFKKIYKK